MSIRLKNRLLGVLVIVFAMCLAFSAMALVLTGARAEESSVTRDTLPNQIGQDVYSAEFGAQGERGWTYWHKGNKPEDEWVQFASSEYDAESRQYAQGSVMLGHLSAVPSAGASLKRTYTPENDGIVRFMTVLFAYNADGGSGDVNYDGQLFTIEIAGVRQTMYTAKIGTAADDAELNEKLAACEMTEADYTQADKVHLTNADKGIYLAYADVKVQSGVAVDLILSADGDEDGFFGEWCDGAGWRVKSLISYYRATDGKVLSNGDVLDETTMPGDFGPIGYFRDTSWDGTEFGMPNPNPYAAQFSGEQGQGGWYYMFEDPDLGLIEMQYDAATGKWLAPADNPGYSVDTLYISQSASVANYARPVIRAYKAEKSGIIRFVGQIQNGYFDPAVGEGMDGQKFYIKNEAGEKLPFLYGKSAQTFDAKEIEDPASVTYAPAPDNELFLPPDNGDGYKYNDIYNVIAEIEVERGEYIYFYDDAVGQPWCDMMYAAILPIYTYVDPADAIGPEEFTPDTVFSDLYDQAFGAEQGTNSWYFLYGDAEGEYYRAVSDNGVWTSGFGTVNANKSMQPAQGYDAIRAWRAENDGKVRVLGLVSKAAEGGDGVTFSIFKKSGGQIASLYTHAFGANELEELSVMLGDPGQKDTYIDVKAGDILFFTVSAGATDDADTLNTRFYVVYTERGEETSAEGIGDVLPPYTVGTVLESQYAQSYASAQGVGGWYKFFGTEEEYYQMRHDGTKWITGYEGNVQGAVYNPSKKYDTINAYRAMSDGKLTVLGSIQKTAAGGDGVDVNVFRIGAETELVKTFGIAADGLAAQEFTLQFDVKAGDWLFFSVNAVKTVEADAVTMKLFAYYTETGETPDLGDDLGDSDPPVKTVDEYTIDDISEDIFDGYMNDNYGDQGENGWWYLYGKGDVYYEMRKDGNNWRGPSNDPYNMVEGARGTAPGMIWDTIRAYQVPNGGYMRIFAHFNFWQGSAGDGVKMTIRNMTTGETIYNEIFQGGPEWEAIHTFASDEFKVSRGDVLFFILNKYGENNNCDNVTVGLYPIYSVKTSDETEPPSEGIGALPFDESAVPPEDTGEEEDGGLHIIAIPKPGEQDPQGDAPDNTGLIIGLSCAGGAVVIAAVVLVIIMVKRKRGKQ